ncbi:MAG TPA: hypothetical protein LFW20_00010 [Rickettsia endosymbiont of Omalisus fontisbellaquei]|nr:hypothetical protein [Rickettsia endosymbiont of Omalisus fontisbellaquei]
MDTVVKPRYDTDLETNAYTYCIENGRRSFIWKRARRFIFFDRSVDNLREDQKI